MKLKIMGEFLTDYSAMLTGSYIAGKHGMNQKSVSNALNAMQKDGILRYRTYGRNKQFSLILEDREPIINAMAAAEHLRTLEFYRKNLVIKEVATKILPHCNGIVAIFGSYAKGLQKEDSDLDIFIAGTCNRDEIDRIGEMYGVDISVQNYPTDLLGPSLQKKDIFLTEVLKGHIIIRNPEGFIAAFIRFYYGKD